MISRAVEHIEAGKEITANYADLEDGLNKNFRLEFLQNNFRYCNFILTKICKAMSLIPELNVFNSGNTF